MTKVLTYLLLMYVIVTTPIVIGRIQSVQAHQNDALHTLICSIESKELHPKHPLKPPSVKQRHQIVQFWADELRVADLAPCGGVHIHGN